MGSGVAVEDVLKARRSVREFQSQPLSLADVAQLLWAAQGVTSPPFRTVPAMPDHYPVSVYLIAGEVEGITAGVYRYKPAGHGLRKIMEEDVREPLANAAYWQNWVGNGSVVLVLTVTYDTTDNKSRGLNMRLAQMAAGQAAQNVYLQAHALELGTVVVGAFIDTWVKRLLHMKEDERPLCIMPVGKPK
jgi:SagB-type dehydrogenase family enzyme